MHIRPKTMRRLMILVAVVFAIGLAVGAAYLVSQRRNQAKLDEERSLGMAAYKAGDYVTALPHFNFYLAKSKTADKGPGQADTEAIFAYAQSRRGVPMSGGNHLKEARIIFERYLRLKPDDVAAQHALLELYPMMRFDAEAVNLADQVLFKDPKDVVALRSKVDALRNQRKFDEALAASEKLNAAVPQDLRGQAMTQRLMLELKRPTDEIIKRASEQHEAFPNDPRFELLLAQAYELSDNRPEAAKWLRAAAEHAVAELDFVNELTFMLDRYGLFIEAERVLEHAAGEHGADPRLTLALIRRTWQGGNNQQVADRLAGLDPKSTSSDTELLAYRAMSLYALNRGEEVTPILDALAARKDDASAQAWAAAIRAHIAGDKAAASGGATPRDLIKQYQAALDRDPDNAVIHFWLGQTYAELGETELAITAWQQAASHAPSWAAPPLLMSRAFIATGRDQLGLRYAQQAYYAAPTQRTMATGFVIARYNTLGDAARPEALAALLENVKTIQSMIPMEQETLPVYVGLLARTGQTEQALAVIDQALKANPPLEIDTLIRLATVSDNQRLGKKAAIFDHAEKTYGPTPQIVFGQALVLAEAGKTTDGLQRLRQAQAASAASDKNKSDPLAWRLAIAQYRELTRDPGVLQEWIDFGNSNPNDLRVQSSILRASSRFIDRAFWLQTIDRVKALSGEEGLLWRTERARWLLTGQSGSKESAEAVNLLTAITKEYRTLVDPHRMLALALEKVGVDKPDADKAEFMKRAVEEMKAAAELAPNDAGVVLELARLLNVTGKSDEAQKYLDGLAGGSLTPQARQQTARALAAQGMWDRAIEVLLPAPDGDPARDAMLAELYRRSGKTAEAAERYQKILGTQSPDSGALADGADFFAGQNQKETAQKFLARLNETSASSAARELVLARFEEAHGTPEAALAHFTAAAKIEPTDAQTWRELTGFHLRQRQFKEAIAAADAGLRAVPEDADLRSLKLRADALVAYSGNQDVQALIRALIEDPTNAAAAEMLKILTSAKESGEPPAKTVEKLEALATRHPRFVPLQGQLISGYLALKEYNKAETAALAATEAWPNDAELARLLVAVYHAESNDERALHAAGKWRARLAERPLDADLFIAQTQLKLRRPGQAVDTLVPYAAAVAKPDGNTAVGSTYARALMEAGREREAVDWLKPLTAGSAAWRSVWLALAPVQHDGQQGAAWIGQIAAAASPDAPAEQLALAEAWFSVAQQCQYPKGFERAGEILKKLTASPDAPPAAWQLTAVNAQAAGDLAAAQAAYEEFLRRQPDSAEARNNLAYVLLVRGHAEDLPRAQELAEKAVSALPDNATFYDTLARIYAKGGKSDLAIKHFRAALNLDRDSLEAMIGLADVLVQSGKGDDARAMLPQIEKQVQASPPLEAPLRDQLDALRSAVKPDTESGRAG